MPGGKYELFILLCAIAFVGLIDVLQYRKVNLRAFALRLPIWIRWPAYYALILIILIFGKFGLEEFYTFNFRVMKAMKLFITKATCFILAFGFYPIPWQALLIDLQPMDVYGSLQAKELNILLEKKDSIQAISLGNSHSGAIDFDTFGMEGQVLARAGTIFRSQALR